MKPESSVVIQDVMGQMVRLVRQAKRQVFLVSPWIHGTPLERLWNEIGAGVSLQVLLRPPDRDVRPWPETERALDLLVGWSEAHPQRVAIRTLPRLHAKIYLIDDRRGLMGSANLTRPGMNLDEGNQPEASILLRRADVVELHAWADELWDNAQPLLRAQLDELKAHWATRPLQQTGPSASVSSEGPVEEAEPIASTPIIQSALAHGHRRGWFGRSTKMSGHYIHFRYNMRVRGARARNWKGSVSGVDVNGYHFDLRTPHLTRGYYGKEITGLWLVPVKDGAFDPDGPTVVLEVARLIHRNGVTAALLRAAREMRRLTVKRVDGGWWLTVAPKSTRFRPVAAKLERVDDGLYKLGAWVSDRVEAKRLAEAPHDR